VSTQGATRVNGYEVEQSTNGAWWVRRPGTRLTWRFDAREAAQRFAARLRPPVDSGAPARSPQARRRDAATQWQPQPTAADRADLLHLLNKVGELSARAPEKVPVARELVTKMEALLLNRAA
jgi:hypothetical protein